MDDGGSIDRPCTACGASIPGSRSVCPTCGTLQAATRQQAAPPVPEPSGAGTPPPGFSARSAPTPPAWAPVPPTPPAAKRTRSWAPLAAVIVVIAALAGGGYFWTQRDTESTDGAATARATTTTAARATTTTAAPITWTPVSDAASGLTFTLPAGEVTEVPGMALASGVPGGPPAAWATGAGQDEPAFSVQVAIWGPEHAADQTTVDDLLRFHHELYRRGNAPYPKAVSIAGAPATALDASDGQTAMLEAVATVDGSLVLVELWASDGNEADPAVFEQILASFAKG